MATVEPPHAGHPVPGPPAATTSARSRRGQGGEDPGVVGNERLTALAGAVLLVLALVEVATVPTLRSLMPVHFFIGVLLAGPAVVKTASTGWRFLRYYTRHPAYRRKGPPHPALRVLAPLLVLSTLAVIGSGIALAATGPAPPILLRIHVISFLVWLLVVIIHVIAYLPRVPKLIADDWRHRPQPTAPRAPGRHRRLAVTVVAVVAGTTAATLLAPTAAAWTGWLGQAVTGPGILAVVAIIAAVVVMTAQRRGRRRHR